MTVVVLARDLLIATRIGDAAARQGRPVARVDAPGELPEPSTVRILLVDWGAREPNWGAAIRDWWTRADEPRRPRIVLFGPHTDLAAHAEARAVGLGPMMARSKLIRELPNLVGAE